MEENELGHARLHRLFANFKALAKAWHGTHRAPKMIDVPHAGLEAALHFRPGRVGMFAGHEVSATSSFPIVSLRARQLRSASGHANDSKVEVAQILLRIGSAAPAFGVRADHFFHEIRAVKVDSSNPRSIGHRPRFPHFETSAEHRFELRRSAGRRGRKNGRRAVPGVRPQSRADVFGGAVHEVRAIPAMRMDVHVAGADKSAGGVHADRVVRDEKIAAASDGRYFSVAANDRTIFQSAVGADDRSVEKD